MNEQDIDYALAKQVPEMARGFTIQTNYGDIVFESGWAAERLQVEVTRLLKELARAHRKQASANQKMLAVLDFIEPRMIAHRKQTAANQKASAVVNAVFDGERA